MRINHAQLAPEKHKLLLAGRLGKIVSRLLLGCEISDGQIA